VHAYASFVLGEHIETLYLKGSATDGTGNAQDNAIYGNDLGNVIDGKGGADLMYGGLGDDTYYVDDAGDLTGDYGVGFDQVFVSNLATYNMSTSIEKLTFVGATDFTVLGNYIANLIVTGAGNDTLDGNSGIDSFEGGAGNDTYILDNAAETIVELDGEGDDTLKTTVSYTLALGVSIEHMLALGLAAVNLTGNELDQELVGNNAANILDGGDGADTLIGGLGNDTYVVRNAGDTVVEADNSGTDLVQSHIDFSLAGSFVENLTFLGAGGFTGTGNGLINRITGADGNDVLSGEAGDDFLYGGVGADTLYGGAGRDLLEGGEGDDALHGGADDDRLYGGAGADELYGEGGKDILDGGDGADKLYGGDVDDKLYGGLDNDQIYGGEGVDIIEGGDGDDLVEAGGGNDFVNGGLGLDTLKGDDGSDTLSGLDADDTLDGGNGADKLYGGDGADTLSGGEGLDLLDGGLGADQMAGGIGNDTYFVDDAGDLITEADGEGSDTVRSVSTSYSLSAFVENLYFIGAGAFTGAGNDQANNIYGGADGDTLTGANGDDRLYGAEGVDNLFGGSGRDWLEGGAGDDVMQGGADNDTYVVDSAGDQVIENDGEGVDTVRVGSSVFTLTNQYVENVTYTGAGAFTGTGNDAANTLVGGGGGDVLSGLGGNDRLMGAGGVDTLYGGAGNDVLDGGDGDDVMDGGANDDTYIVNSNGDAIVEGVGGGLDTVRTSTASFTLQAELENLFYTGAGAFTGVGNDAANTLSGGGGADNLSGEGGNDRILAGAGDDVLNGGAGVDSLTGGFGRDILTGGADADYFVFTSLDDFAAGADKDQVADFNRAEGDRVFLNTIDAVAGTAANDAFAFIGAGAFTNTAGQLRYAVDGANVRVQGDVNGDGVADFELEILGTASLLATDFVL
jgi:Ca2+-binding RTX toxin-like protein